LFRFDIQYFCPQNQFQGQITHMNPAEVLQFTDPNVFYFLKSTGYFKQTTTNFNTETFYIIPAVFLYLLFVSQNKQRIFPIQRSVIGFFNRGGKCLLRGTDWVFKYDGLRFFL
jgi:hypothetical protein